MAKQAISVTLEADNLTWLKGRAGAAGRAQRQRAARSARDARRARRDRSVRRVRSSARSTWTPSDPWLEGADEAVRDDVRGVARAAADGEGDVAGVRHRRGKKQSAPWLNRRRRSPTRTRSCFTPPAAASSGRAPSSFFDRCERREAILYVPAVVMWECSLLARVSRINLRRTVRAFFDDLFSNPSYQPLDVTPRADLPGRRAAVHARSVRRAHLRRGADDRSAADHARRPDPRIRHRQGDLVIERTIAIGTHGRYLIEPPAVAGPGADAGRLPRLRRRRRRAARADASHSRRGSLAARVDSGASPLLSAPRQRSGRELDDAAGSRARDRRQSRLRRRR